MFAVAGAMAFGGKASADLITNGDFSMGNVGFTSGYVEDSSQNAGLNAGANSGAGYYGIVTDSQYWHPLFTDFHDHTGDQAGLMMIVNGDNVTNTIVWSESGINVTPGDQYELSFWAASAYPVSPATLNVTASVNAASQTFDLTSDAGVWHQFSMIFTATSSPTTISLADTNLELSGNDFALDDISLTQIPSNAPAVPLPASALSGSVLLAGVAAANKLRKRRLV
jgi:hypothetical protein